MLVLFILPVPSGYDPGPMKYSLLTQFLRQSGILPIIALRISEAAISLSSVADASLQNVFDQNLSETQNLEMVQN